MPDWKHAMSLALAAQREGRHEEARRRYREILESRPDEPDVLHFLGLAEYRLGGIDSGLALVERSIALDPSNPTFRFNYGKALLNAERAHEAVRALRGALELKPDFAEAFFHMTSALIRTLEQGDEANPQPPAAGPQPAGRSFSVVVCSVDAVKRRRICEQYERLFAGHRFEIVVIPDARSLCEGYNRGFARSSGELVVFSHDDIQIATGDLARRLLGHFADSDLVGVAGTTRLAGPAWSRAGWPHVHGCVGHRSRIAGRPPHYLPYYLDCYGPPGKTGGAQALDGVFFAATREACEAVPFDERIFDGFHLYDVDFSYRAFLAGLRVAVVWDILIVHDSSGDFGETWRHYADRFMAKHRGSIPIELPEGKPEWTTVGFADVARMRRFHRRMLGEFAEPRS